MYLHLRTAHTRFGCTASIVYGLLLLSNVHSKTATRLLSVRTHILVMDFQILSHVEDFEGDIVLALSVRPSSLRPSGRLWTTRNRTH